jgi:hypothetical protein
MIIMIIIIIPSESNVLWYKCDLGITTNPPVLPLASVNEITPSR